MQTRILKEAGVSTNSSKVVLRNDKSQEQTEGILDQTNKFKPANHGEAAQSLSNEDKLMKGLESLLENGNNLSDSATSFNKSKSLGSNASQIKTRGVKNSIKDEPSMESGRKSAEMSNTHIGDEEMMNNNSNNSSGSLTACTKEEQANKLKSEEKSNQKLSQMKNKDEKSPSQSSDKSEKSAKEDSKDKKPLVKERERICLQWMKDLSKLEAEKKNLPSHVPSDDMPMYCSNKICPISEQKIAKNPKVLNLAKKVLLRKVIIQEEDERWYCLKCLKAHNEALF